MFRNFANQIFSGKLNDDWPMWALKTQQVLDACLESARQREASEDLVSTVETLSLNTTLKRQISLLMAFVLFRRLYQNIIPFRLSLLPPCSFGKLPSSASACSAAPSGWPSDAGNSRVESPALSGARPA